KVEVPPDQYHRGAKLNKRTDLGKTKRSKTPGNRLAYFLVAAPLVVLALVASWIMFEKEVRSLYSGLQIESLAALHDSIGSDVSNEPLTQVQLELDSDVGMETGRTTKVTLEESTIRETAETEKKEPGIWDDVAAVSPSESRVNSMDVPEKDVQTKVEPVAKEELFYLQAGAFSNRQNAERFGRMRSTDSMDYSIVQKRSGLWSLVLGPLGRSDAEGILDENRSGSLVLVSAREYLTNQ
ncbi:MAG: SPOR domain-containing protein, partial [Betaproteobacteria bacterium]